MMEAWDDGAAVFNDEESLYCSSIVSRPLRQFRLGAGAFGYVPISVRTLVGTRCRSLDESLPTGRLMRLRAVPGAQRDALLRLQIGRSDHGGPGFDVLHDGVAP